MAKLIFETKAQTLAVVRIDPNRAGLVGTRSTERVAAFRTPLLSNLDDAIKISTVRPWPFGSARERQEFKEGFQRKLDGRFAKIEGAFRTVMTRGNEQERKTAICMLAQDFAGEAHNNTLGMALANIHLNSFGERSQLKKHVKRIGGLLNEFGVEHARRLCGSMGRVGDMIFKPIVAFASIMVLVTVGTKGFSRPFETVGYVLLGILVTAVLYIDKMLLYGYGAKPLTNGQRMEATTQPPATHVRCQGCSGDCACHDQH